MAGFEGMTLTKLGQNLLAECMNGKNMKFSRVVVGSGLYTGNIEDIEDIIEKQLEIEIQNIKIEDETAGQINVQTYFNNENLENAFYFREIALYAIDDETNNEILYAYSNCGENAEYINVMSNETNNDYIEKYIDIVVKVGNINNVNVTIRKHLRFNDLSVEELAEIKTNVTNYYKRYERTYKTTEENETNIEIGISQYNEGSILEVYVEGRILNKDEYTINGTNSITLATPLSEIGTEVLFVVYRSVCAVTEDLDKLKGDKGDSGAIVFDCVADMKANTDLVVGDTCQTLGYYSVNDGGAGLYKIVNDDTLVDDGGFVHELENGLKAELIIEKGIIEINSLGADSKGIKDSSDILNYACEYINRNWLNNNFGLNTINFNGKYLLNKQIKINPFSCFTNSGYTVFLTNVSNDSVFFITYLSTELPTNLNGTHQSWCFKDIFNFKSGCKVINQDGTRKNTCIEIGTRENMGYNFTIARYKIDNINIENFDIAILHNIYNNYIAKFKRVNVENNNIGVQYGVDGTVSSNSGEHMSYDECLFASTETAIKWCTNSFYTFISNSSLDFNENIFDDTYQNGYHQATIENSHVEGNKNLFKNMGIYSTFMINNNRILFKENPRLESSTATSATSVDVLIENNKISHISSELILPSDNIIIDKLYNYSIKNNTSQGGRYYAILNQNMLNNTFDNLEDGEYEMVTNNKIGNLKIIAISQSLNHLNKYKAIIQTDNYLYERS